MSSLRSLALAAAVGAAAMVLPGCATPDPGPGLAAQAVEPGGRETMEVVTGSRIPRKSTDRLLRTINASGARDMDRERPPEPGMRGN